MAVEALHQYLIRRGGNLESVEVRTNFRQIGIAWSLGRKHATVAGKPPLGVARGEDEATPGKPLVQLAENRNPRPVLETLFRGGDTECFREIPAHDLWDQREVLPLVVVAENFEAAAERGGAGLRPADAENLAPARAGSGLDFVGAYRIGHDSRTTA